MNASASRSDRSRVTNAWPASGAAYAVLKGQFPVPRVVRVVGRARRLVDPRVGVSLRDPGVRRGRGQRAVVAQHHRRRGRRAPRLTAAAPGRVVTAVRHLRVARHVERDAARGAGPRGRRVARGQPRDHRADAVHGRARRAVAAQQRHPQLPGGQAGAGRGPPGVDIDVGQVVALPAHGGAPGGGVAGRPPAERVPARRAAGGAAPADLDLDPAVAGRGRGPRRDQLGQAERARGPGRRPASPRVVAAGVRARADRRREHDPVAADPHPRHRPGAELGAGVPPGVADLPGHRARRRPEPRPDAEPRAPATGPVRVVNRQATRAVRRVGRTGRRYPRDGHSCPSCHRIRRCGPASSPPLDLRG